MRRIITGIITLTLAFAVVGSVQPGMATGGLAGGVIASHAGEAAPQQV